MNVLVKNRDGKGGGGWAAGYARGKAFLTPQRMFQLLSRLISIYTILAIPYWLFVASDRYVSEADVIIQRTDQVNGPGVDVASIVSGSGGPNRSDQLLLREYLLSEDMLKKLDASLDLRSHYSNWHRDPITRFWFRNAPIEWFYRYWLSRSDVNYDDYSGVLRIQAQAYDSKTAHAIVNLMVMYGEEHMNQMGHQLAQAQVDFLAKQVTVAHDRLMDVTQTLIDFQNKKGLVSPQSTAESLNTLIAKLEAQRTDAQTQLASLPASLNPDHPIILLLKRNLVALGAQIAQKRAELASPSKGTLNYTVEEFQRLQMNVNFVQDLYKTALSALEKGRMDAARTLKKVSILQTPTVPDYPLEPRRLYNILVTLLLAGALAGGMYLAKSIVLDHVD
jgi:capsular polysaccharide transport system permease protein